MSFKKVDSNDTTRPEGKVSILVYGYTKKELIQIESYAKKLGIENTIEVEKKDAFLTLENIINEVKANEAGENPHNEKAIVLNAVSDFELNSFISNFKTLNVKRPLFAVVTQTSINWKFNDLLSDLIKERSQIFEMQKDKKS